MVVYVGRISVLGTLAFVVSMVGATAASSANSLEFKTRRQVPVAQGASQHHSVFETATWDPKQTAIVICDMWDQHWCQGATKRVAEMAPRMNKVVRAARKQGALVIHCPSSCLDHYRDSPQRRLAKQAPQVAVSIPLQNWCSLDLSREAGLPIDDSDGGCDCQPTCAGGSPWTRQIETLEIGPDDAITDSGEAYYLMQKRGIKNVLVMGVHTNMCVLGRPFSIRQLVYQGMNVVLMRDMTDTMYNSRMSPFVNHHTGTDLVVQHIERHWCPTTTSDQLIGGKEFRFPSDQRGTFVAVIGEREYQTQRTIPDFCNRMLASDFRLQYVFAEQENGNHFPGIETVADADVVLLSVRRRGLSKQQLTYLRDHVEAGKPLVAIRTSSHAFAPRLETKSNDTDVWPEFDHEVLGGNYQGHHNNKLITDPTTFVRVVSAGQHPILEGVRQDELPVASWLYKVSPLADTTTPLMTGRVEGREPHEPVAWINEPMGGARVFYTSLGHPQDFRLPAFQRLLANAIYWAADQDESIATR
ncbi:MAG: ThuA domain-containing protein [Pirellulaceae bacterium]|nr:ThuA domain-containing protein [Pirellulaceae bacterium]